jgi:hypothetical protein
MSHLYREWVKGNDEYIFLIPDRFANKKEKNEKKLTRQTAKRYQLTSKTTQHQNSRIDVNRIQ